MFLLPQEELCGFVLPYYNVSVGYQKQFHKNPYAFGLARSLELANFQRKIARWVRWFRKNHLKSFKSPIWSGISWLIFLGL